jgi:hypothetical protein
MVPAAAPAALEPAGRCAMTGGLGIDSAGSAATAPGADKPAAMAGVATAGDAGSAAAAVGTNGPFAMTGVADPGGGASVAAAAGPARAGAATAAVRVGELAPTVGAAALDGLPTTVGPLGLGDFGSASGAAGRGGIAAAADRLAAIGPVPSAATRDVPPRGLYTARLAASFSAKPLGDCVATPMLAPVFGAGAIVVESNKLMELPVNGWDLRKVSCKRWAIGKARRGASGGPSASAAIGKRSAIGNRQCSFGQVVWPLLVIAVLGLVPGVVPLRISI